VSARRGTGVGIIIDPSLPHVQEMDTFTCAHCQKVVFLHEQDGSRKADQGGFCMPCMKAVCGPCADAGRCTPFEKKLEAYEAADAARRRLLHELGR
jgi:hypothetical protein